MDKNAIKKYAVWARRELISRVSQKAYQYGINENDSIDANADNIYGKILTDIEKKERKALIAQVQEKGFEQVMEEVAYTWFNRFSALRFMEVNGYLPTHVRVFTDEENKFKPQILTEAIHMELDGLDMDKVYSFLEVDNKDELYKYLLITQCNALNKILPEMFQKITDYTELLFPDNLLCDGSVIEQMIVLILEEDWKDAVQIIGWLYQYYNTEPKDTVFANLKKNIKITKENIPAATQLFTPDWIVRYMVENSIGRLWLEGHPDDELKAKWNYYMEEAEQEADVEEQLDKIRKEYKTIKPDEIRVIDPCMGSGHILVYAFDVLIQIYEAYGFNQRDAAKSIVEKNIYGLDIDERAAQLAYFAVMMKARQYDRRFFNRNVQHHIYAIRESNHIDSFCFEYFINGDAKLNLDMQTLIDELYDAKEYGSILNVTNVDFDALYARFDEIRDDINMARGVVLNELLPFVQMAQIMAQKYDAVITNPPYMGNMPVKMTEYVRTNYHVEKYDLYAVFVKRCRNFAKTNRFVSMITQQAWMFLSSFEKFRYDLKNVSFINLLQLGAKAFDEIGGEVVQTVVFSFITLHITKFRGVYENLVDGSSQVEKERMFIKKVNIFESEQDKFSMVPGNVFAYWVSDSVLRLFSGKALSDYSMIKSGIVTGNNDYFLKLWYEIDFCNIGFKHKEFIDNSNIKWVPMHKGGGYRKHYGLHEYVMNLHDIWEPTKTNVSVRRGEPKYYFKIGLTWSTLSTNLSVRRSPVGFVFDTKGSMCFPFDDSNINYVEGLLNSKVSSFFMSFLSPTLDFNQGAMAKIPIILDKDAENIDALSEDCIELAKLDWDAFETSWDFKRHPLLDSKVEDEREIPVIRINNHGEYIDTGIEVYTSIENAYENWKLICNARFNQLKAIEEELNRIFIDKYGLHNELTPEVEDKDVTVRKADLQRDIKGLISYAVGCMLGRYSFYSDGLLYAGGVGGDFGSLVEKIQDSLKAKGLSMFPEKEFYPDADNIIPICDDEYFSDDILGRFVKFIQTVYGADTLEDNLKFIADALGGKGSSREVIRNYFLNDFYNDHCKMYQKRPIYWLFDSGKKNGFKALIYIHRYQPDTIARMRTDYVHEQQERYRTAILHLEQRINEASTSERVKLNKQLISLKDQEVEIRAYEEKIHHLADQMIRIDLDDGVNHNYEIFKDVLAKIK